MKTNDNMIMKIISLPIEFYKVETESFYDLLKETGYFIHHNRIFEDDIAKALKNNSELIKKWFEWSENKRSSEGWYLIKKEDEKYEVGLINKDGSKAQFLEFFDKRNACATFIKREIDQMRVI